MSTDDHTIRELVDACRPDGDELHMPEMAPLAERVGRELEVERLLVRSQQIDALIQHAIRRVPIPDGLAERLFARLSKSSPDGTPDQPLVVDVAPDRDAVSAEAGSVRRRWDRRTWSRLAAGIAVVAATITLVVIWLPRSQGELTDGEIRTQLPFWTDQVKDGSWVTAELPAEFRETPSVPIPARRWQKFTDRDIAAEIVCCDLTMDGRDSMVRLFIVRTSRRVRLPKQPPVQPFDTQGVCVGAWKEKGLVYALVVEGDSTTYRRLILSSPGIAACATWATKTEC